MDPLKKENRLNLKNETFKYHFNNQINDFIV